MSSSSLNITTIDCTKESAERLFETLRQKLSPRGDVTSEAGRQRTISLFGEPRSPQRWRGDDAGILSQARSQGTNS